MGVELAQGEDFSVALTQEDFAKKLKVQPTSPALRAGRKNPLSIDYAKLRQRKLGELRWIAMVSRPDIRARLARLASWIHTLCGCDVYRMNELVRVAKDWQQPSHPWKALGWSDKVGKEPRKRRERAHCGSMTLVEWSDAAYGTRRREESADWDM